MNTIFKYFNISVLCIFVVLFIDCNSKKNSKIALVKIEETNSIEVKIEAENFTSSKGDIYTHTEFEINNYVESKSEGWIALDVNIPVAGRYKSEIHVSNKSSDNVSNCWIEDYYDNKDDRQYNISGTIRVNESTTELTTFSKEGTPLNSGLHRIKLHFDNGIIIDWVKFTLIKEHEVTPLTLMQKTNGKNWKVIWSDEFNEDELDTNKWTYDFGNWGWGNGEVQYYTVGKKENVRLEDGSLVIEARKEKSTSEWTSARLTTRGKVSFLYGKIEFRAKVPHYKGNWAAGWTLGDSYVDELSWPYCGEIDILESVGYEMNDDSGNGIAHASAHSGAKYFKLGNQPTNTVEVSNMNNDFHRYSVEWSPEEIVAYVDDKPYFSYNDTSSELSWPFNTPQNIILNLTIGGGWGGYYGIDDSTNSQKMIVDYVRVYESQ